MHHLRVMVCLVACSTAVWAGGLAGPRPGKDDPLTLSQGLTVFSDDELLLLREIPGDSEALDRRLFFPDNVDLTAWHFTHEAEQMDQHWPAWGQPILAVDKGLLDGTGMENVVYAYFSGTHTLNVELLNGLNFHTGSKQLSNDNDDARYNDVDVCAGDLDLYVDGSMKYQDEVVVAQCYKRDYKGQIRIHVLDGWLNVLASQEFTYNKSFRTIKAQLGDVDNDGVYEIVVAARDNDGNIMLRFYWWDPDTNAIHTPGPGLNLPGNTKTNGFDLAVGDFNGDEYADAAVLVNGGYHFYSVFDGQVFSHQATHACFDHFARDEDRIAAGLFYFQPSEGYGMNRCQLAALHGAGVYRWEFYGPNQLELRVYLIDDNFNMAILNKAAPEGGGPPLSTLYQHYDLAVGNFAGHDVPDALPTEQVAVSAQEWTVIRPFMDPVPQKTRTLLCCVYPNNNQGWVSPVWEVRQDERNASESPWKPRWSPRIAPAVIAFDANGDSYRLGPPAHMVVEKKIHVGTLLQEPPKHVDFLPVDPQNWDGPWQMYNVSGYPEFHVTFGDEEGTSVSSKSTSDTSHSIGGSLSASFMESFRLGTGEVLGGRVTFRQKLKVSGHYESHHESWSSSYHSRTSSFDITTNEDDILYGKYQLIDIWRYPIINMSDQDGKHTYHDIILPGPFLEFSGGANKHTDWYFPSHQNRCLFSYPDLTSEFPTDLGKFKTPDGKFHKALMNARRLISYDANATTAKINWSSETGSGDKTSHEHSISEEADLEFGYQTKARVLMESEEENVNVSLSFNNSNSWADSNTSENETTKSKEILIEVPDIPLPDPDWSYAFLPAVYVDKKGVLKVTHAVDFDELDKYGPNWRRYYGGRPDLSLNLPERFLFKSSESTQYGEWVLKTDPTRMAMRAFQMRYADPDPVTGYRKLYGREPVDGEKVLLQAHVYNFCMNTPAPAHDVRFDCVLVDGSNTTELPSTRTPIGTAHMGPLDPRGSHVAEVEWDTTGLSNPIDPRTGKPNAYLGYRVYVVVDPGNQVQNEVHEWKDMARAGQEGWADDQGRLYHGNNEGYWPQGSVLHIASKSKEGRGGSKAIYRDVSLGARSLGIEVKGHLLKGGPIQVSRDGVYRLRVRCSSAQNHAENHPILFEAQRKGSKPHTLGTVVARGMRDDTHAWLAWQPRETGTYTLRATILEHSEDVRPGDATDELNVRVVNGPVSSYGCNVNLDELTGKAAAPASGDLCLAGAALAVLAAANWRRR